MVYSLMEKNLGQLVKEIREKAGISQRKLAEISGVSRQYINFLESGKRQGKSTEPLIKLARALNVSPQLLLGIEDQGQETNRLFTERMEEMLRTAAKDVSNRMGELIELPILGCVPCGYPEYQEQQDLGKTLIPKSMLGNRDMRHLVVLIASGESMTGDEIFPGYKLVIDPTDKDVIEGKIYVVRVGAEVAVKHVSLKDGRPVLLPSNAEYKEIVPDELEILGRVVLYGNWKEA
jgi:SOS-response transcriptional repressor LexA